ncbi:MULTISPECIES: Gp49 family protein [Delftia]|uniref:Uncharacterized protein n=2 Tax=Delftia TaxID=80865 RepID=A0A7T2VZF7_DELAC|nr:hypothetical protein [Delftia acidovorans]QPS09131.1 hypothetical protein I6G66_03510 [Delftia acidovorans]
MASTSPRSEPARPDAGHRVARDNAVQKVWPLLGFRLHDS